MLFCYFFFHIYFYFNFPIKSQLDAQSSSQNAVHSFIAYMSDGRLTKPQWILKQIALLPNVCFFFVKNFFYSHSLYAVTHYSQMAHTRSIYIYICWYFIQTSEQMTFFCVVCSNGRAQWLLENTFSLYIMVLIRMNSIVTRMFYG